MNLLKIWSVLQEKILNHNIVKCRIWVEKNLCSAGFSRRETFKYLHLLKVLSLFTSTLAYKCCQTWKTKRQISFWWVSTIKCEQDHILTSRPFTLDKWNDTQMQSNKLAGLSDPRCKKINNSSSKDRKPTDLAGAPDVYVIRQNTERVIESLFFMALSDSVNLHSAWSGQRSERMRLQPCLPHCHRDQLKCA